MINQFVFYVWEKRFNDLNMRGPFTKTNHTKAADSVKSGGNAEEEQKPPQPTGGGKSPETIAIEEARKAHRSTGGN